MGYYEHAHWLTDGWGATRADSRSGEYHPYVPDLLANLEISLSASTALAISKAETAIRNLDISAQYLVNTEPLARLIMRSEAIASSRIEGLEVPVRKLLEFEELEVLGVSHRLDSTEAAVLANITSMQDAIRKANQIPALTLEEICLINRKLLEKTDLAEWGGVIRNQQNWIGGSSTSPLDAAYVPPRPDLVEPYMQDLVTFCNKSELPAIAKAAIAHAQIETIHPFIDGNGRTGRTLIHIIMRKDGLTNRIIPPVSLIIATHKREYIEQLSLYRINNEESDLSGNEAINRWISFFCDACIQACDRAQQFEYVLESIRSSWLERGPVRKSSAFELLANVLPGNPVISISSAARLINRSEEAARLAVHTMCEREILKQNARNKKSNLYVAQEIISAFTAYERALATPGFDTSQQKPARPSPQRI